jgi:hypothetical protein
MQLVVRSRSQPPSPLASGLANETRVLIIPRADKWQVEIPARLRRFDRERRGIRDKSDMIRILLGYTKSSRDFYRRRFQWWQAELAQIPSLREMAFRKS